MTASIITRRATLAAASTWIFSTAAHAEPLILQTSDGVRVTAFPTMAADPAAPLILLFHMAGSNAAEYAPIAQRLAREGYASLAIDQRSGGRLFGRDNETARHAGSQSFDAALLDLEAALAWAVMQQPRRRIAVLGSSYSAALVFVLAARHAPDIAAVLAFSPGEFLNTSVKGASAHVTAPVFVTSAQDSGEEREAAAILGASPAVLRVQYRPVAGGVHGASTLRSDANPGGVEANWQALLGFLTKALPRSGT